MLLVSMNEMECFLLFATSIIYITYHAVWFAQLIVFAVTKNKTKIFFIWGFQISKRKFCPLMYMKVSPLKRI